MFEGTEFAGKVLENMFQVCTEGSNEVLSCSVGHLRNSIWSKIDLEQSG